MNLLSAMLRPEDEGAPPNGPPKTAKGFSEVQVTLRRTYFVQLFGEETREPQMMGD